jgi:tetratricopeptide (TPR) repeat protein
MRTIACRFWLILAVLGFFAPHSFGQTTNGPLSEREVLALVAGNALSENIVHEIDTRGLAFQPGEQFRSLVTEAGADSGIVAALNRAKTSDAPAPAENDETKQLLQHLAGAGKFVRNKQYGEATQELTAALQNGGGTETGFVMAEVLRAQEQWGNAEIIFREVLRQEPDFPEAHTKLSYELYRINDGEEALREARIALAENPNNAEAHKNAGLALQILNRFNASEVEYNEALRLKPDYEPVRLDLGLLFANQSKYDRAIEEYKKALILDPDDGNAHYALGAEYEQNGNLDSAIHEYREAKRLNPRMFDARSSLGHALMARRMYGDAVREFRELEAMYPDSPICHICLGNALFGISDLKGAEKELRTALALDPSEPYAHEGLGRIREEQKDYDAALAEFRRAEQLDDTFYRAFIGAGRVLLQKKDFPGAVNELKHAEALQPSDAYLHDLYGQALLASGNSAGAIAQFKDAIALGPKQDQKVVGVATAFLPEANLAEIRLELAAAYQKDGDVIDALDQFHQAALIDFRPEIQSRYKEAQDRFKVHIAALKASGKSAEAEDLEARLRVSNVGPNTSQRLDDVMHEGHVAAMSGHADDVEKNFKEAVELAQKLQPPDDRLKVSLLYLANLYAGRKDYARAEAAYQQALKVTGQLHGAESPMMDEPLQELGHYSLTRQDYNSAFEYYSRAVAIDEKAYGETSNKTADSLRKLSFVFLAQRDYAKAEPYLLRAVRIDESLYGPEAKDMNIVLTALSSLYDKWNKPEKAEPRYRQMLAILEKQYGPESPVLVGTLVNEGRMLRQLGRVDDAAKFEERAQAIRTAMGQPDGTPSAQAPN